MNKAALDKLDLVQQKIFSNFSYDGLQQKYVLLLMVRIAELCSDASSLLMIGRFSSAPILLRSALESYVDLKCMILDEEHADEMRKSFNLWMSKEFEEDDPEKSQEYRDLANGRAVNIKTKFIRANEEDTYKNYYSSLCRHAHGNLERLITEHVIDNTISIGHEVDSKRKTTFFDQAVALRATALHHGLKFIDKESEFLSELNSVIKMIEGNA